RHPPGVVPLGSTVRRVAHLIWIGTTVGRRRERSAGRKLARWIRRLGEGGLGAIRDLEELALGLVIESQVHVEWGRPRNDRDAEVEVAEKDDPFGVACSNDHDIGSGAEWTADPEAGG